ncbi:MAG: cache domain-containing protein [Lachnospiraceae bacterium]|nr:cache domain-containing protein [Lachnospiraceae bacterium]
MNDENMVVNEVTTAGDNGKKKKKLSLKIGKGKNASKPGKNKKWSKLKALFTKISKIVSGFTFKLIVVCAVPMLVVALVIVTLSVRTLKSSIESEIEKSLHIVAASVAETYNNLYEGDYNQDKGGKVKKGENTISGDNDLVDALKEQTGFEISFIYGDMRLLTTMKKDNGEGRRINGSKVNKELVDPIKAGEELFIKGITINALNDKDGNGTECYLYYMPLYNSDGSIIGAIEVATPSDAVSDITGGQTVIILIVAAIFILIAIAFALLISSRMGRAMKKTKAFLDTVKEGNLVAEPSKTTLKRKDELGDIYRTSIELQQSLTGIVGSIIEAADALGESAGTLSSMAENSSGTVTEVADATSQIVERASSQAADAKYTSDGVNDMNEDIKQIKSDMAGLVSYAESMAEAEQKNRDIVEELHAQSDKTRLSLDKVQEQIERMNRSVQSIEKATTLITDIADETELLSLNASIEAARAGEAGRGFAVVAEQIGKLADQSNNSTGEITLIIKEVMDVAKDTAAIMQEVYDAMDIQQRKLDETRKQSEHVSDSVDKSIENISEISGKVDRLRESSHDIKQSVITLAEVSERTATTAESTITTVESMQDTMSDLKNAADRLTVLSDRLHDSLGAFRI